MMTSVRAFGSYKLQSQKPLDEIEAFANKMKHRFPYGSGTGSFS